MMEFKDSVGKPYISSGNTPASHGATVTLPSGGTGKMIGGVVVADSPPPAPPPTPPAR
jgi:hypothetical protein